VVGKSVTTEFAYFRPGKTANPHDVRRTPGGSSSGSAAAVASRMVAVGFGSQTAGSLTRPASYCGVVGFKPSFGRYSLAGVKPLAPSMDTLGWMARTVDDVDLVAKALVGRAPGALSAVALGGLRIGVASTAEWPFAEQATRSALAAAAARFQAAGATIDNLRLPELFATMAEAQSHIMAYEAAATLEFEANTAPDHLSPQLLLLIRRGLSIDESAYLQTRAAAAEARRLLGKVFGDYDVLLAPSAPGEAPLGLDATGDPVFSRMWSLMRVPSITLPGLVGSSGMPVGIQLVGGYLQDDRLLGIAKACSAALAAVPAAA
jgi:Asp-tRNA(Asn)/Glu-tRNA(Gln) amidotransferase A subunit family amidase